MSNRTQDRQGQQTGSAAFPTNINLLQWGTVAASDLLIAKWFADSVD